MRLLQHHGITPILVFDGDRLPAKAAEEEERRVRRAERKAHALALLEAGNREAAESAFQACVDVTPAMAREVMDGLQAEGFAFLTAPYEADAQLGYLARTGQVDIVATEDSDLVAYGCPHLLFKLDRDGNAFELRIADLFQGPPQAPAAADDDEGEDEPVLRTGSAPPRRRAPSGPLSFHKFDQELFLCMCILAGCDFLPSMPGIGIRRAHALASRAGSVARVIGHIRLDAKLSDTQRAEYLRGFKRALATFKHARVYDASERRLVPLTPLSQELVADDADTSFLGADMSPEHAAGIAEGRLCPFSRRPFPQRPSAASGERRASGAHAGRHAHAGPQLQNWPPPESTARHASAGAARRWRRSDVREEEAHARRPLAPSPPRRINANVSGLGHLLREQCAPTEDVAAAGEEQQALCELPLAAAAAAKQSSNPFARGAGHARVSQLFARAAAAPSEAAPAAAAAAAPPPAPPKVAGASSVLGRMWTGALSAGAAWLESPSKAHAKPAAARLPAPAPKPPAAAAKPPKPPAGAKASIARFFSSNGTDKRANADAHGGSPSKRRKV